MSVTPTNKLGLFIVINTSLLKINNMEVFLSGFDVAIFFLVFLPGRIRAFRVLI